MIDSTEYSKEDIDSSQNLEKQEPFTVDLRRGISLEITETIPGKLYFVITLPVSMHILCAHLQKDIFLKKRKAPPLLSANTLPLWNWQHRQYIL